MNRIFAVASLIFTTSALWAAEEAAVRVPTRNEPTRTSSPRANSGKQKLREGGKLTDVRGRFEFAGERIAFYPVDGSETLPVLENLALERTTQIIQDSRGKQEWIVSGILTEYRGNNYLLLTKAVVKGAE